MVVSADVDDDEGIGLLMVSSVNREAREDEKQRHQEEKITCQGLGSFFAHTQTTYDRNVTSKVDIKEDFNKRQGIHYVVNEQLPFSSVTSMTVTDKPAFLHFLTPLLANNFLQKQSSNIVTKKKKAKGKGKGKRATASAATASSATAAATATASTAATMATRTVDIGESNGRVAGYNIRHGQMIMMNSIGSGSSNKTLWHTATICKNTWSVCGDLIPKAVVDGTNIPDDFAPPTSTFTGAIPAGNERAGSFVQNNILGNIFSFDTDKFSDMQRWPEIHKQLRRMVDEEDLTPLIYEGREAATSGCNTQRTMELLRQIPEFDDFITDLEANFVVRAFWIIIHFRGSHPWHPDSFTADATHRFILSLGCNTKRMGFANYRDINKDDVKKFIEE
jgi:hypothetical protein